MAFVAPGGMHDHRYVVLQVFRGGNNDHALRSDEAIGELRPDDIIEIAAILPNGAGGERLTWATSTVTARELGLAEGMWSGSIARLGDLVRGCMVAIIRGFSTVSAIP